MDNYEQNVYVKLMASIRPDIEYIFEIFEAYKYFSTDEIKEAICMTASIVASDRKIGND